MKNKEKYAKEIVEIACNRGQIAIEKSTGKLRLCEGFPCRNCMFDGIWNCDGAARKWAESEYFELVKISKRDRSFLDYLKDRWKYMARDNTSNAVYVFTEIPEKSKVGHFVYTGESRRISSDFNVVFPMVKWENSEPWLIEDLKKLEVVEEYE